MLESLLAREWTVGAGEALFDCLLAQCRVTVTRNSSSEICNQKLQVPKNMSPNCVILTALTGKRNRLQSIEEGLSL